MKIRIATLASALAGMRRRSDARPDPVSADEAAIREARRLQTEALARNDLDAVAMHWTDDITIRRALGHPVESAAAARQLLAADASADPARRIVYQRHAVSVQASTDWPLAFEEGRWSGHAGLATSRPILEGRYAAQWVKRDGRWLIRAEVFVALTCAGAGCQSIALP